MKWAHGADGPARSGLSAAAWCRRSAASLQKIEQVLESVGLLRRGSALLQAAIEQLFDNKPDNTRRSTSRSSRDFKAALNAGAIRAAEPDASEPSGWRVNGWVKKGILLGFRMGGIVDMSIDPMRQPFFDKSTYPVQQFDRAGRRAHRARRIEHSRRLLHRQGRYLHAADVHQRRRVCGRRHHGRFARAGGKLRAGRQELPHLGRVADRRRAGAGGRAAGDCRRRRPGRRQLRRLRRHGREEAAPCWAPARS